MGFFLGLCGLATAAIARGHGPLLQETYPAPPFDDADRYVHP
jgi:hypothetical protein